MTSCLTLTLFVHSRKEKDWRTPGRQSGKFINQKNRHLSLTKGTLRLTKAAIRTKKSLFLLVKQALFSYGLSIKVRIRRCRLEFNGGQILKLRTIVGNRDLDL